jgi:DNA mismatch repair protein MLH1
VLELRAAARADAHADVSRVLGGAVWVGLAKGSCLLVQHETRLLLLQLTPLSSELFRQAALRKWAAMPRITFATPVALDALARIALGADASDEAAVARAGAKAAAVRAQLVGRRELLDEYCSIAIDAEGNLASLPQLAAGYVPPLCQLPAFVLELAGDVDWRQEKACFEGIARALGRLYALRAPAPSGGGGEGEGEAADAGAAAAAAPTVEGHEWTIRHVLLPRLQRAACFSPPRRFAFDGTVTQVACTQTLYRIFERC